MGEALKKEKINTKRLFELIQLQLEDQSNQTGTIHLSVLADQFHVSRPAILYQIEQFIKSGHLEVTSLGPKKKQYHIVEKPKPIDLRIKQFATSIDELLVSIDKKSNLVEFDQKKKEKKAIESFEEDHFETTIDHIEDALTDLTITEQLMPEQSHSTEKETYDDFISRIQAAPTTELMMTKTDHQILAVMIESINQQSIYLKDLADQLSYAKDKSMIQYLIEDRNRLLQENEQLKEEVKTAYASKPQIKKLDEQKLRLYQQNLIHMLSMYTSSAPHELAIKRHEFKDQMATTIQDLIKYCMS